MALMEFLEQNELYTTTQMTLPSSNTGTGLYLFDRNIGLGFTSVGYATTTTLVLGFSFSSPVRLSHILLQNHNLRDFRIYYNSVTANSLLINATNSATSTYLSFSTVSSIDSVDIQINGVFNTAGASATDTEKKLGEAVFTERRLQFERNPSAPNWKPSLRRKQIIHEMPDGGVKVYNIRDKFRAQLSWQFVTDTFATNLRTVFTEALPLYFLPFPTSTGWASEAYEVAWIGDYNFTYGDNAKAGGQNGSIEIMETAGG